MEKLLIARCNDVAETANNYRKLRSLHARHFSSSDPHYARIHIENLNPNGRIFKGKYAKLTLLESSIHNNIMHDCNRHRKNGYRDKTWDDNIKHESIENFQS